MTLPHTPISWGELFDKITILEIKLAKLTSKAALKNVNKEYEMLRSIYLAAYEGNHIANQLVNDLTQVNIKLWDIEDKLRSKERKKLFDDEFTQLARSVYFTNDERSRIKRQINETFFSDLIEEKSYDKY